MPSPTPTLQGTPEQRFGEGWEAWAMCVEGRDRSGSGGRDKDQRLGRTEMVGGRRTETQRVREVAGNSERRVRAGSETYSGPLNPPCPHLPAVSGLPILLPLGGREELLQGHEAVLVGVHLGSQVRVSDTAGPPCAPLPPSRVAGHPSHSSSRAPACAVAPPPSPSCRLPHSWGHIPSPAAESCERQGILSGPGQPLS